MKDKFDDLIGTSDIISEQFDKNSKRIDDYRKRFIKESLIAFFLISNVVFYSIIFLPYSGYLINTNTLGHLIVICGIVIPIVTIFDLIYFIWLLENILRWYYELEESFHIAHKKTLKNAKNLYGEL